MTSLMWLFNNPVVFMGQAGQTPNQPQQGPTTFSSASTAITGIYPTPVAFIPSVADLPTIPIRSEVSAALVAATYAFAFS